MSQVQKSEISQGKDGFYNYELLFETVKFVTKSIDRVIDRTRYPLPECERSNKRHRPMAIGIQGLSDTFDLLRFPYESKEAAETNRNILETIYFAALTSSCELAQQLGPYPSFKGSPTSEGILQFDMWGVKPTMKWDWDGLKAKIKQHGLRNSLLVGLMPTASTSQILGNTESFELPQHNYLVRRTQAGDFIVLRKQLIRDLIKHGLWTEEFRNKFIQQKGSIQNMMQVPKELRDLYKTSEEVPLKAQLNMSLDRGPFVDQTQSLNITIPYNVNGGSLEGWKEAHRNLLFYLWKKGAKTGSYYTRMRPQNSAIQFTVDKKMAETFDLSSKEAAPVVSIKETEHKEVAKESKQINSLDSFLAEIVEQPACESCGS
jgi:ribonucleotide reductase alpha subunit